MIADLTTTIAAQREAAHREASAAMPEWTEEDNAALERIETASKREFLASLVDAATTAEAKAEPQLPPAPKPILRKESRKGAYSTSRTRKDGEDITVVSRNLPPLRIGGFEI